MPRVPDFLVIGATKAGTTSLYRYLSQHPGLFLPKLKEPNFLAFHRTPPDYRGPHGPAPIMRTSIRTFEEYTALFEEASRSQLVGEASPLYLYHPEAPSGINRYAPNAKLIAVLRDPAERAWSSYQHLKREGREPLDFEAALDVEEQRIEDNWGILWRYVDVGRYGEQLQRYLDVFDEDQLLFLHFDDLTSNPLETCRAVFRFLGVASDVQPEGFVAYNVTGRPKSRFLYRVVNPPVGIAAMVRRLLPESYLARFRRVRAELTRALLDRQPLPESARQRVATELSQEIRETGRLTGLDVEAWLP